MSFDYRVKRKKAREKAVVNKREGERERKNDSLNENSTTFVFFWRSNFLEKFVVGIFVWKVKRIAQLEQSTWNVGEGGTWLALRALQAQNCRFYDQRRADGPSKSDSLLPIWEL